MKIELPNSAFLGNIDGTFFRRLNMGHPERLDVKLHPNWISVHPLVLAMAAALGLSVPKNGITCDAFTATSAHYLERMGLFKYLCVDSGISITEHESAGRFVPLRQIRSSTELSDFLQDTVPLLHLEPAQAKTIWYIVSELVRNVLEHAETEHGAIVAAQYYKKSNRISIGIADTGIGIRKSLSRSYPRERDADAIALALTPGITGTTTKEGGTEQNAGAGLFFVKSIAKRTKDYFVIYSGNASYKLLKSDTERLVMHADPLRDKHSLPADLPYWQGTAVGIDLTLDKTPEFTSLLTAIRETYFKAVRDRKQARYRKPTFI